MYYLIPSKEIIKYKRKILFVYLFMVLQINYVDENGLRFISVIENIELFTRYVKVKTQKTIAQ